MSKERLTKRKYEEIVSSEKEIPCSNFCNKCSQGSGNCKYVKEMIEKLAEYEDLEEQGLILRLPCPIGTKVYYIQQCWAPSCKECLGFTRVDNCYTQYKARIFEQEFDYRHLKTFGESVFLTQSEAEEKLRELEKNYD